MKEIPGYDEASSPEWWEEMAATLEGQAYEMRRWARQLRLQAGIREYTYHRVQQSLARLRSEHSQWFDERGRLKSIM